MSLLNADVLLLGIDDEDEVGNLLHILDTADVAVKLLPLLLELDNFLLGKYIKGSVGSHVLDLFKTSDT